MNALARWSFRHKWTVLALWLLALVAARIMDVAAGSNFTDNFQPANADSTRAQQLLSAASPRAAGDMDRIVFAVRSGSLASADNRERIGSVVRAVAHLPHVASVVSPFVPGADHQVSADQKTAYATVRFDQLASALPSDAAAKVISVARTHAGGGLQIELGGEAISDQAGPKLGNVLFGIIAAALVLFLAFGSLVAMALPLGSAIMSLGVSLALVDTISNSLAMPTFTTQLASLIGLGVGIDYAMFIVSRFRTSLLRGQSAEDATVNAVNTAGRAVLFAGLTVCIAMLGMFAIGLQVFRGVAVGASISVVLTVLAALTLQPALLGVCRERVLSRRQRRDLARGAVEERAGLWVAWAARLQRRPGLHAGLGVLLVAVLAIPFFSLRLGFSDAGDEPTANTSRRAYDLLAEGFGPGFNGPLDVVARYRGATSTQEFSEVLKQVEATSGVAAVSPAAQVGSGPSAVLIAQATPTTAPQDAATADLVHRLRSRIARMGNESADLDVRIGGATAADEDFSRAITSRLALFIGIVIALSFVLLAVVFRSLLVPLVAAVMNLLAVGAAFGVVTAVFEKGRLKGVVGLHSTGPIEPFIPVIVFAILFGLSMDYEVFLVSRMHEIWKRTQDNTAAVTGGLRSTGRVITAAAAIMIFVFGSFALGDNRIIKLFGLGLASAVVIDALIIRALVMPAVMLLLGRANWAMPAVLERHLPRLDVEGADGSEVETVGVAGLAGTGDAVLASRGAT